jgi:tRNA dimethylallyltransferase
MSKLAPLVAIVGPTAAGKSALGIEVARRWGGEVVCCDSTQLYRQFDVGTAKVRGAEQLGVPHHLVDLLKPHEVFTAGDYRRRALAVLEDLRSRGRLPVFTVGTGLYLRALLEGLADAPARSEDLRERLRRRARLNGAEYVHRLLARFDPPTAARVDPHDTAKVIRAIEVCLGTGRPMSQVLRQGQAALEGYQTIKIGLLPPRPALYNRIERRTHAMMEAGWLEEVQALLAKGLGAEIKPFQFIGYGELRAHLAGMVDREKAVAAIQQATRRYAKRQISWFRREPGVVWFPGFGEDAAIRDQVFAYLSEKLEQHPAAGGS